MFGSNNLLQFLTGGSIWEDKDGFYTKPSPLVVKLEDPEAVYTLEDLMVR